MHHVQNSKSIDSPLTINPHSRRSSFFAIVSIHFNTGIRMGSSGNTPDKFRQVASIHDIHHKLRRFRNDMRVLRICDIRIRWVDHRSRTLNTYRAPTATQPVTNQWLIKTTIHRSLAFVRSSESGPYLFGGGGGGVGFGPLGPLRRRRPGLSPYKSIHPRHISAITRPA